MFKVILSTSGQGSDLPVTRGAGSTHGPGSSELPHARGHGPAPPWKCTPGGPAPEDVPGLGFCVCEMGRQILSEALAAWHVEVPEDF